MNLNAIEGLTENEISELFEETIIETPKIACTCTCYNGTYMGDYAVGTGCILGGRYYCWANVRTYGGYSGAGSQCQSACHYNGGMSKCS